VYWKEVERDQTNRVKIIMWSSASSCGIPGISKAPGFLLMLAWSLFFNTLLQDSPEKSLLSDKQVAETKRILTSDLEAGLPKLPFANWFGQTVGREAGVIWQLSECGEQANSSPNVDDKQACMEANAILPDGRKVVVMILIGSFKKGLTRTPEFYYGVIEQQEQLYMFRLLSDLPRLLQSPESLVTGAISSVVVLPKIAMEEKYKVTPGLLRWNGEGPVVKPQIIEELPPPPLPQEKSQQPTATSPADNPSVSVEPDLNVVSGPPKQPGSVTWGDAITKVQPRYPANAKRVMASGKVEVQITISKGGLVTAARAISGHPLLHDSAAAAARQWVFKPATLNGNPIETMIVLTFDFKVPE